MRIYGARNLVVTFLLLLIWSTRNHKLMALSLLGGMEMALVDGLVSKWQIGGGEWNHWSFLPVLGGLVAGLFGWFG
jgi:hypothetical protein